MIEQPVLSVDGLEKTFGTGGQAVHAVEDVSFEVGAGEVVGLLGPNGAGKTTTIKSILGLVVPDAGTVEIAGTPVHEQPAAAYNHVGAILEGARNIYWRLTVRENLAFFAGLGGEDPSTLRADHDRLLELLGLADRADTPVKELSRGMKQKVSLASTLARDVDIVFLDEPTLGLDVEATRDLQSELRRLASEQEVTIVLSSHDMDVIETVCDRVIILNEGTVLVDEEVSELLDVFELGRYRIGVEPALDEQDAQRLGERFGAETTPGSDKFEVNVTAVETLYSLLSWVRKSGYTLETLTSHEPTFEDVFLYLVEKGAADERLATDASEVLTAQRTAIERNSQTVGGN
jgi:ABC-2 type transport system ATP-binding protein